MKTLKECQDWLRGKNILNKFYLNFYSRDADWHPEYHSVEDVYNLKAKCLINTSFEWSRTPENEHDSKFWYNIHMEFVNWFGNEEF